MTKLKIKKPPKFMVRYKNADKSTTLTGLTVDELDHSQQVSVEHKDQGVRAPLLQLLHDDDLRRPLLHGVICRRFRAAQKKRQESEKPLRRKTRSETQKQEEEKMVILVSPV